MPVTPVPIRVALVHDARVVDAGLRLLTAPYSDRVLMISRGDPVASAHRADVVLHGDARPPLFRRVTRGAVEVLYSARPRPEVVRVAVAHGAAGFACKDWTGHQLATVLLRLVEARDAAGAHGTTATYGVVLPEPGEPGPRLSPREGELLQLIAHGLSNDEIAAQMMVSVNSVKSYIRSAYRKIGVTRRTQAVLWVLGHDLATRVEGEASLSRA